MKPSHLQLIVLAQIGRDGRDLWPGDEVLLDLARAIERDAPHLLHVAKYGPPVGNFGPRDARPMATVHLRQGGRAALDGAERQRERERRRKLSAEAAVKIAQASLVAVKQAWQHRLVTMLGRDLRAHPEATHAGVVAHLLTDMGRDTSRPVDRYVRRCGERLLGEQLDSRMDARRAAERMGHLVRLDTIQQERLAARATTLSSVAEQVLLELHRKERLFCSADSNMALPRLLNHLLPDLVHAEWLDIVGVPLWLESLRHWRLTRLGRLVVKRLLTRRPPKPRPQKSSLTAMEADLLWFHFGRWTPTGPVCLSTIYGWEHAALTGLIAEHESWFQRGECDGIVAVTLTDTGRKAAMDADTRNHNKGW